MSCQSGMTRIVRSEQPSVAGQAREMGIKVGDVITGMVGDVEDERGWWQEDRLTLRYLGEQCCVWKSEWRNKAITEFRPDGESANFDLSDRDWHIVRPDA